MEQNYYTSDEAMVILEPHIRAMFRVDQHKAPAQGISKGWRIVKGGR